MKSVIAVCAVFLLAACGRNEPGTMGGEPGVPETVATGAPAEAARETSITDADRSALASEQAMSSFDDSATNQAQPALPDSSTRDRATEP